MWSQLHKKIYQMESNPSAGIWSQSVVATTHIDTTFHQIIVRNLHKLQRRPLLEVLTINNMIVIGGVTSNCFDRKWWC